MKPKSSAVKGRLAPLVLILSSQLMAQAAGDLAAHQTDDEKKESIKAALPFLEAKVASTIMDGASEPIAFEGQAQIRTLYHHYYGLADSSYLGLTRQGLRLGAEDPFLKLGMVVTPGRNTVLWTAMGLMASFPGVNPKSFLGKASGTYDEGYTPAYQNHASNKSTGVIEDMSAGIAIRTKPASFMLKMGAMNWNESSPLSIWKAQPRMFAWEYLPYEMEEPISEYYGYNIAKGEKAGRAAWNKRAFQGVDFSITDMPGGLSGYVLYGSGMPYDGFDRTGMDMAVDLGYAADEGPVVETGIGDSYRKQLYYRIAKVISPAVQVGFNNGYVYTSSDIIASGSANGYVFNNKFDIGLLNSEWDNNGTILKLKDKASYNEILKLADGTVAKTVGEGFWIDPKVFSVDAKGNVGKRISYFADLGFSMVESTFVKIDNAAYGTKSLKRSGASAFSKLANSNGYVEPGSIFSVRKSDMMDFSDIATYLQVKYSSKVDATVDFLYSGEKFYSPNSFVLPNDIFFARGSNLLGAGKFLGAEASPYSRNMIATGIEVKPNLPWYGHLKLKYGINAQVNIGRDVIMFPYRLNGNDIVNTFNSFYSKWGVGKIDETYDFNNHQGEVDKKNSLAKHPIARLGDESYGTYSDEREVLSPTSGGLRGDNASLTEGFVPYTKVEDLIFNHFSKSSVVDMNRDLAQIWDDEARKFEDNRLLVNDIRIVDGNDTSFYTYDTTTGNLDQRASTDNSSSLLSSTAVSTTSASGFVPVTKKSSFDLSLDWALDISKYIGYDHDLFVTMYYEINGVTKGFKPLAVSDENEDVLLMSHYLRSEPTIALTKKFYLLGLVGFERWSSNHGWVVDNETVSSGGKSTVVFKGFKRSPISTNDLALGIGFDWDAMKRVSFHGRYKWFSHEDAMVPDLRYKNHSVAFELKSFF